MSVPNGTWRCFDCSSKTTVIVHPINEPCPQVAWLEAERENGHTDR